MLKKHYCLPLIILMLWINLNLPALGQQAKHDDHDLPAPTVMPHAQENHKEDTHDEHEKHDDHDKHNDHEKHDDHADHDEHAGHDDHDTHDDHDDEYGIKLDDHMAKQFGIRTAKAGPGQITRYLTLSGEVVFNADHIAHVTPAVAGIVSQVHASVGDRVKQGQMLARLSSRELAGLRSELLASKARWELVRENATRDERLFKDKVGTERAMLESRQLARDAQIQYSLAENAMHALGFTHDQIDQMDSGNHQLNHYELTAPIEGVITQRHLTMGENITPNSKDASFVIADLSSVWVNLSVYQRDLAKIKNQQEVILFFGHEIPDAKASIAFITPGMDEQTRTATARVILKNPHGVWRPGLFVTGKVQIAQHNAAIVVPVSAVVQLDEGPAVFVLHEEGFEPTPVKIGQADEKTIQILDGLQAGQTYVSSNAFALKAQMQKGAFGDGHNH